MPTERHTILLIDDDTDQTEPLGLLLGSRGYEVTVAGSGAEGMAILAAGLRPSLIVLDLNLPTMNSLDFIERQRRVAAAGFDGVPVILYSNRCDMAYEARAAGVAAGVEKPNIDRLFHFVALLC